MARGILDRAERYRDHGSPDPARATADRARRVAEEEAAVRATLSGVGWARRSVDAVDRIQWLLGEAEATAATDPERAEALVDEARELADGVGPELRASAADRAEAARRADDPERARRRYAEAYELADAAARLAVGEGPGEPSGPGTPTGGEPAAGTGGEGATASATGSDAATESETATGGEDPIGSTDDAGLERERES